MNDEKILDIQEIDLGEIDNVNPVGSSIETNLGEGVEFLMNEKKKNKSPKVIDDKIDDINDELNDIDNIALMPNTNKEVKYNDKLKETKPVIENILLKDLPSGNGDENFKPLEEININEYTETIKKNDAEANLREKFEMLRKLESLEGKGANLSKRYTMDSDLKEMKGEYEFLVNEKEKDNSIKFQGKILTTMITGLEFLNSKFDPFDIKIDGWSEQVTENVEDYDEIFAELHEKYKSNAKMAPEIKLLFQLASSGIMIHMTNTMFKSSLPGMDDIMRQNPDLMRQFTSAAMNSMESNNPGLSNFMNDLGGGDSGGGRQPPSSNRSSNDDLSSRMRNEMSGPKNIDDLLSNMNNNPSNNIDVSKDESSTISIDDLKSLSKKGSKRKSDKTTINLAI